jgi:hypothetical protein
MTWTELWLQEAANAVARTSTETMEEIGWADSSSDGAARRALAVGTRDSSKRLPNAQLPMSSGEGSTVGAPGGHARRKMRCEAAGNGREYDGANSGSLRTGSRRRRGKGYAARAMVDGNGERHYRSGEEETRRWTWLRTVDWVGRKPWRLEARGAQHVLQLEEEP